jgi:HlyD family secretion protein
MYCDERGVSMAVGVRKYARMGIRLSISTALLLIAAIWTMGVAVWPRHVAKADESVEWVTVKRMDLLDTVVAGGDLQPVKETMVACEVENTMGTDGIVIVSLVSNGATVKKGDELCRLDSSALLEEERQELISLSQARATCERARLTLEVARISLAEYQDGLVKQTTAEYEGKLALGRSDVKRQADRVSWSEAMKRKGYASGGVLLSEQQALAKSTHELLKTEREFDLFRRFTSAKEIVRLRGEVQTAEINYRLEAERVKTQEELVAEVQKQLRNCVIRAPHDGMAVRTGRRWWSQPIEEGVQVYERQNLFKLPDLTQMEVEVSIHETMGPRVRPGMKAQVHIASILKAYPGTVTHITMLPDSNWKEWDESLKHFMARVRLEKTPVGALPFMSASVEIETERVADALVIPTKAMSVVSGRQVCTVMSEEGPELRTIHTRRTSDDLLEVTEGLSEGDQVAVPYRGGILDTTSALRSVHGSSSGA